MAKPAKAPSPWAGASQDAQDVRIRELRAIALFALVIDRADFPAWRYYAELKHLSSPTLKAEWLEARIATCVAGEIRPAYVVRAIKQLRALRQSTGAPEAFDAFECHLKQGLGERRLTNHGFGGAIFSDIDHSPVWDRVGTHIDVLKRRGYTVFLNSGTLLGVVRDQRLIDHDDDIDLAIILNAKTAEEASTEWKVLLGLLRDDGVLQEEDIENPAIAKLTRAGEVKIDLFPAWFEGDQFFLYPHTWGTLGRSDVLPLQACKVSGYPIPAEPEKMLAINYGDGWREPDPYFKFPWSKTRSRFRTFLQAFE